jgi:hypothetical protein
MQYLNRLAGIPCTINYMAADIGRVTANAPVGVFQPASNLFPGMTPVKEYHVSKSLTTIQSADP